MIKKRISLFIFTCLVLISSTISIADASVLHDQFVAMESSLKFDEQTLYTFIQDRQLLEWAERLCNPDDFELWKKLWEKITAILEERYLDESDASMLIESLDLRNRVHAMHGFLPVDMSDTSLCMRKVVMYLLQQDLRIRHITVIDEEWLIGDFNDANPPLLAVPLKVAILETLLNQSRGVRSPTIKYTIKNPEFLDRLSDSQRQIAKLSAQVMERAIKDVLLLFLKKWLFTQTDIDRIRDKFVFEWTENCSAVAGRYEVQYEIDRQWKRRNTKTSEIHLTVSACTNIWFVLQKYDLAKLIVIHELGHHTRRYKDQDTTDFTTLCRNSDGSRNDRCVARDFVSDYAQTAPEEDYAEHFQQWVIRRRDRSGFIDDKLNYFEELFK